MITRRTQRIDAAALARIGALMRDESPCSAAHASPSGRTRGVICLVIACCAAMLAAQIDGITQISLHEAASSGSSLKAPRRGTHVNSTEDREMAHVKYRMTGVAMFGALGMLASTAHGTDRLVPQQYATIQAAVDASVHGDTITLAPGLYRESVQLRKSVTLQGALSARVDEIVLTATGVPGPALILGDTGSSYNGPVTIRHLTVDGEATVDAGEWAGLVVSQLQPPVPSNSLLIEDCIFRDLRSGNTNGGAAYLTHSPTLVRRCLFARNRSTGHGAVIYTGDGPQSLIVEECFLLDHTVGTGAFYARIGAHLTVRDCVVKNSNVLCANFQTGTVTFENNIGCSIGALSNGGYVDGGGNNWLGPCPDCDANGVIDLEEILFHDGDCNANGLLDACELPTHPEWDSNQDGIIDSCQCLADISGNGSVDGVDLAAVLAAWGSAGRGKSGADIDGNGTVDAIDLAFVLDEWGACEN